MKNNNKPKSLVAYISEDLEDKILKGIFKPGQRIIEGELCKSYGISQTPLREALRILESQGYVTHEPRRGVSVTTISANDIEDIYRIRANLESLATYLAIKKYNSEVLNTLKKIHKKMINEAARKDVKAYFALNLKFHEILINACQNKRLIQIIETFVKQTKRYRIDVLKNPENLKRSIAAHEQIIQSFESGDAEKAEQLRKESILRNIQVFLKKYKEEEEKQN